MQTVMFYINDFVHTYNLSRGNKTDTICQSKGTFSHFLLLSTIQLTIILKATFLRNDTYHRDFLRLKGLVSLFK